MTSQEDSEVNVAIVGELDMKKLRVGSIKSGC